MNDTNIGKLSKKKKEQKIKESNRLENKRT